MNRYILINAKGVIVNVIVWDGTAKWQPPSGLEAVAFEGQCEAGWVWDGAKAKAASPTSVEPPTDQTGNDDGLTVL